jgi:transcriptional regulator with XRE-family HTH domain
MPQPRKIQQEPLEDLNKAIAGRLKVLRKGRGLSQAELAQRVGLTREAIAAYESGRVRLVDDIIIRFASALQVSSDELLGIKPTKSSDEEPSLRFTKRFKDITKLPEDKKKAILKILDDLIRANN